MAKRDYAQERANRDARYRAKGFKGYNDYETQRRRQKARDAGHKSYYAFTKVRKINFLNALRVKERRQRESELAHLKDRRTGELVDRLIEQLERGGNIMEEMPDLTDPAYWDWFRVWYSPSKRQVA